MRSSLGENKTAIILSGGDPENLRRSATEFRITARVGGSTVIERAVRKLRMHGFKTILVVGSRQILTAAFDLVHDGAEYGVGIIYVEEKEFTGTASTLRLVKGKVASRMLVVYGHIIFDKVNLDELWSQHLKSRAIATLMLTTSARPAEKGTVRMEGNRILEFVQKPKKSDVYLVYSPIFVAEPEILNYDGSSLEYDVYPTLTKRGLLHGHMSSEREYHVHSAADIRKARQHF